MDVRFYIPEGKVIPTTFRLKVDDKYDVYYKAAKMDRPYGFAYDFTFWSQEAIANYKPILNEIVRLMIWQSQDHDVRWVETKRDVIHEPEDTFDSLTVRVYFRIRDAG